MLCKTFVNEDTPELPQREPHYSIEILRYRYALVLMMAVWTLMIVIRRIGTIIIVIKKIGTIMLAI